MNDPKTGGHPGRSWLFVPASDGEKVRKAPGRGADVLLLDLEDGVAEGAKDRARAIVADVLAAPVPVPTYVRINHPGRWLPEDIEAALSPHLAGFMLPKAESEDDVRSFLDLLVRAASRRGMEGSRFAILPLVESAAGVENARAIAAASPQVVRLALGAVDLALDLGLEALDSAILQHARARLVLASRAAGVHPPVDTVDPDFQDLDRFREACATARRMGFAGKLVIHPRQVSIANETFSPTPDEVARARELVAVYERAAAEGTGAVGVDGRMVDRPMYEWARRVLTMVGDGAVEAGGSADAPPGGGGGGR
ncbi:CoA ester lyase [Alicyclobacillus sp.]|uniref:HpcH/HpaI aldolase/citrate lyase family protein n=1 Tax=Alicyclobacillus sp. TaxID=61169 RepID=UPI0025C5EA8E|nr:CoA ester lyase [Alicyclobacillus sp.]MCL6516413.1 CoA ester lyase [Alicyclobacillus sp.]